MTPKQRKTSRPRRNLVVKGDHVFIGSSLDGEGVENGRVLALVRRARPGAEWRPYSFTFYILTPYRVTVFHDDASTEDKGQLCVVLLCHWQDEDGLDDCRLCSAAYVRIVDRTVFESNCGPFGRNGRSTSPVFSIRCLSLAFPNPPDARVSPPIRPYCHPDKNIVADVARTSAMVAIASVLAVSSPVGVEPAMVRCGRPVVP